MAFAKATAKLKKKKLLVGLPLIALALLSIFVLAIGNEMAPRTRVHVMSKTEALGIATKFATEWGATLVENSIWLGLFRFLTVGDGGGYAVISAIEIDSYTGLPREQLYYPPIVNSAQELQDIMTEWRNGCVRYVYIWTIPINPLPHPYQSVSIDATTGQFVQLRGGGSTEFTCLSH